MLYRVVLLFLLLIAARACMHGQLLDVSESLVAGAFLQIDDDGFSVNTQLSAGLENPRLVAIALDVALGLFGMHRLYLGTDIKVPIAYTLTFGGGAVLWFVDLIMLIAAPDIKPFMNNPHFFMWIPPANAAPKP